MHKITLFPLGNADCCRIDLANGKKILFDYADVRDPDDPDDVRCDLSAELRRDLEEASRRHYEVVAFTHLDRDHFKGASDFFYLEHAKKYQSDDRIKIDVMWVPAAFITEAGPDDAEARILQKEARHRFKKGQGIRIFSRPERLREWCEENDVDVDSRLGIITNAGDTAREFSLEADQAEFFVHSPLAVRQDANTVEDRNADCLVMQATFQVGAILTKALLLADVCPHRAIVDIVVETKKHKNESRLEWDIAKLPHHCSYRSLNAEEKGEDKTDPVDDVAWLFEQQGLDRAIEVSTSKPIPTKGSAEDGDDQPPHRQAANYYTGVARQLRGQFVVTMEHPSENSPRPVVIEIDHDGATLKKTAIAAAVVASTTRPPRAG